MVPVLTRLGCNSGACHGKLAGQNGFKLSLRGYAPELDHVAITRDARGRRIAKSRPRESLLLAKPLMRVPHKGGKRLDRRLARVSDPARLGRRRGAGADRQGAGRRRGSPSSRPRRTYKPDESQALAVVAVDSDGGRRDVTALALFKSNEEGLAAVDETGQVTALRPGATAVMASFQGQVAVHVVTTPYDHKVDPRVYDERVNFIDDHVMAKLREVRLEPSPRCDDATFLRRASLDLTGTLPEPEEVEAFLADAEPVEARGAGRSPAGRPGYVDYWAQSWGELFQNRLERDGDKRGSKGVRGFARWIREQVEANRPWDEVVRDVLTARGPLSQEPAGGYFLVNRKPEDLAEAATHAFLGTRIGCAKCHNHPLERFTQDDYYGMAAFFTRVKLDGKATDEGPAVDVGLPGRAGAASGAKADAAEGRHRRSPGPASSSRPGRSTAPRPPLADGQDPREALAAWMTSPENRLFARAIVNRVWKRFFAVGLVEPVDDLRATNPRHERAAAGRPLRRPGRARVRPEAPDAADRDLADLCPVVRPPGRRTRPTASSSRTTSPAACRPRSWPTP